MSEAGRVTLDDQSGRLAKTVVQEQREKYLKLDMDAFAKIPEIAVWIKACEARGVEAEGIAQMKGSVRKVLDLMKSHPKSIVVSKKVALEFWANYCIEFRKLTGKTKPSQGTRTSFRNFLDAHDISFGHGMAKGFNLGSEHDSYKKYAGATFTPENLGELDQMMVQKKDDETRLWTRLGVRTGARSGALAGMTWDRIYFDDHIVLENAEHQKQEFFKIEVHETKDKRGHFYLGRNGDWKTKFLPIEIADLLKTWKASHPTFRRFVFFEDAGADVLNRKRLEALAKRMPSHLSKQYYKKMKTKVDPLTTEYMFKRPDHVFRHTIAQLLKNAGFTDEQISVITGHRDVATVSWYATMSVAKQQEIAHKAIGVVF